MNPPAFDVIGVGACAVDYMGIVSRFPQPDTKNRMKEFIRQGGGPASTGLVALSRLGATVSYLGKLGDDELSRFALDAFLEDGVDISHVVKEKGASPAFAFIITDEATGERTILWTDESVSLLRPDEMDGEFIASAKFLLLDEYGAQAALEAARLARQGKGQTVLDAENPDNREIEQLVRLTDVLIVPEEFALGFSGKKNVESAAEALLRFGPRIAVVTSGAKGAFCKTVDETFHQPAFQVKAVDTTGCGDVFHGGFIYGLLRDWPLKTVTEFASAVSALKCRALGGRTAAPTMDEMKEFLLERGSEAMKQTMEEEHRTL